MAAVICFCAPTFMFYGFGALDILTGKGVFVVLALVSAGISPFAFVFAAVIGLIGLFRSACSWQVRLGIIVLLLIALKIQIDFSSRTHYW